LCQWLFARIHPNLGVGVANYWSTHSRIANDKRENAKPGEQEWLVIFSNELIKTRPFDYLIFGHRHMPLQIPLTDQSLYVNLGEWVFSNSYAVFDGEKLELHYFEK